MPIHNSFHFESNPTDPSQVRISPAPLAASGPLMQVEVAVTDTLAQYLTSNSMEVPAAITGMGLIDTGASMTAIDSSVISRLNINPIGTANVFTPQGSTQQGLYPIKLAFIGTPIIINFSSVLGSELLDQGIIALIGRDVLSSCILIYNGSAGHFSLSI